MTQDEAFEMLKCGYNIFLTGSAGSGKTFLLNKYIHYLKEKKIKIGVTASTGLAATHLDGRTIHSWAGIGIEEYLSQKDIKRIVNDEKIWERIKYCKALIIDEISMLNANRLDMVNAICQTIRQDLRPFGGLQIVLCGDFFQLPPISIHNEKSFVFDSQAWQDLDLKICYLTEQYRQEEKSFYKILDNIRSNDKISESYETLIKRLDQPVSGNINPTKLLTHNVDVDSYNQRELSKIKGESVFHEMRSEGLPKLVKKLKESLLVSERLELKVGAIVMFVRNNFEKAYANGTIGEVIAFTSEDDYPIVRTLKGREIVATPEKWVIDENNEELAAVYQIPLRLAWAITVHKSQGMSLDCAEIDLSKTFEYGMGYVALSRVRSLKGIKLLGLNKMALQIDERMIRMDKELIKKSRADLAIFKKMSLKDRQKLQKEFLKTEKNSHLFA